MTKKDKKELHELYEKHYGKGKKKKSKAAKEKKAIVEKAATTEEKAVAEKRRQSRADLMAQAKEKGIKNFRVLNKEELRKVMAPDVIEETISQVIQGAVTRWKSGWGKKGARSTSPAA